MQGKVPVGKGRPALGQAAEGMGSSKGGQEAAGGTGVAEEEGPSGNSKAQAKQRYKEGVGEKRGRTGLAEGQIPLKRWDQGGAVQVLRCREAFRGSTWSALLFTYV